MVSCERGSKTTISSRNGLFKEVLIFKQKKGINSKYMLIEFTKEDKQLVA